MDTSTHADRLVFAGDWVSEFVSMETAARTGVDAAASTRRALDAAAAPVVALTSDSRD